MSYAIHFNAMLMHEDEDLPEPVLRYLQLGILDDQGYSGIVIDYCGGGSWDDLYYLHGEQVEPEDVAPDDEEAQDELDGDDYEAYLTSHYPGLVEAIGAEGKRLYDYREGPAGEYPVALPPLLAHRTAPTDELISSPLSLLSPVAGHHTSFDA